MITAELPLNRQPLEELRKFDAALYSRWEEALQQALSPVELDTRAQAVITVAIDSVVHWSPEVAELHISAAFDAGANVLELLEAIEYLSWLESGIHGLHDGLEALDAVVKARRESGLPVPVEGDGLGPDDFKYEAPWPVPPVFPYHSPSPRKHNLLLAQFAPALFDAYRTWIQARFTVRKELTRKMQELLVTACDTVIYWPEPLLDHHIHAAFEVGATGQEIVETMVVASYAVQGARGTNRAGHISEGVAIPLHHGLMGLERVLSQRVSKQLLAPLDRNAPRVGRAALTEHDEGPGAVPPSLRDAVRK